MNKWLCNVRPEDRISAEELRTRVKLKSMRECLQGRRLQWFCHLETVEESFPRGRPSKAWNVVIRNDVKRSRVNKEPAKDRNAMTSLIRNRSTHLTMENRL